jgi:sulfite reductase (ferredoxin)
LNFLLKDLVPLAQIVPTLTPLLEDYKKNRSAGESFGDYCQRMGAEKLQGLLAPAEANRPAGHA